MSEYAEWLELWIEAYGGLMCPFPRLTAMRSSLIWWDSPEMQAEYERLCEEERKYNEKRQQAREKYLRFMREGQIHLKVKND